jgi:SAM-dependent methyltransferase
VLNPGFSLEADRAYGSRYSVPQSLAALVVGANSDFATGREWRTQPVYGDELWFRLGELGLRELPWDELRVLDACCGSGFLSYHLLKRAMPASLTLLDVSRDELAQARDLVVGDRLDLRNVSTVCGDLVEAVGMTEHFDVIVGHSFLHHFPDVRAVLAATFDLLRPGGLFIGLHEPTPVALALESGRAQEVLAYFLIRQRYLRGMRHPGPAPMRDGTTDVWIFNPTDLRKLLIDQGFAGVRIVPRYLLRPFLVARLGLYLGADRPRLSRLESRLLMTAVRLDRVLQRALPARVFGGLSFVAQRPA